MACNNKSNYSNEDAFNGVLPRKGFNQETEVLPINDLILQGKLDEAEAKVIDLITARIRRSLLHANFVTNFNKATTDGFRGSVVELLKAFVDAYEKFFLNALFTKDTNLRSREKRLFWMVYSDQIKKGISYTVWDEMGLSDEAKTARDAFYTRFGDSTGFSTIALMKEANYLNFISAILGDVSYVDDFIKDDFIATMQSLTVVDTRRIDGIITDGKVLTKGIASYQLQLYTTIRDFLLSKDLGFNASLFPKNMYSETELGNEKYSRTSSCEVTLLMMYNYLKYRINDANNAAAFHDLIYKEYIDVTSGKRSMDQCQLLKAVSAFINLMWFDNWIDTHLSWLHVNPTWKRLIHTEPTDGGGEIESYKYSIDIKKTEGLISKFGKDWINATEQVLPFSKALLLQFPYIEHIKPHTKRMVRITPSDFIYAFTAMYNMALNMERGINYKDKFLDAVFMWRKNPHEAVRTSLEYLFSRSNQSLLNEFYASDIDDNAIDVLYSAYQFMFVDEWGEELGLHGEKEKKIIRYSLQSIEDNFQQLHGVSNNRYNLLETLYGMINSVQRLSLILSVQDADGAISTEAISRNLVNRNLFGIVYDINTAAIDNTLKELILANYDLKNFGLIYTVDIAGLPRLYFLLDSNKLLLDKTASEGYQNKIGFYMGDDENGRPIYSIPTIDLSRSNWTRLISNDQLDESEMQFMGLVRFIDTMLNRKFSSSERGLELLNMTILQSRGNTIMLLMLATSIRALKLMLIYNKLETTLKDDNTNYSELELNDFIKTLAFKDVYDQDFNSTDKKFRAKYFFKRGTGEQFSVVNPKETWIKSLSRARAILQGDSSYSVVRTFNGNNMPRNSPWFYFASASLIFATIGSNTALANNFFAKASRYNAISNMGVNLEVKVGNGATKEIRAMSLNELLYDNIINKWIAPLMEAGSKEVYILICAVSDKTKIPLARIALDKLGYTFLSNREHLIKNINNPDHFGEIKLAIIESLGKIYKASWQKVLNDYSWLLEDVRKAKNDDKVNKLQQWLKNHTEADLMALVDLYNADPSKETGAPEKIVISLEYHYRKYKSDDNKEYLSINELLYNNAIVRYADVKALELCFNAERALFAKRILEQGTFFNVDIKLIKGKIVFDDNGNTLTRYCKKAAIDADEWVEGNKLVIAKVNNLKFIYGNIPDGETVTLNPILEAFFLYNHLLANNIYVGISGTDANMETSQPDLSTIAKNNNTFFVEHLPYKISAGRLSLPDIAIALSRALSKLSSLSGKKHESEEATINNIRQLYIEKLREVETTALIQQTKRNMFMSATGRPVVLGALNGMPKIMRVSVIEDFWALCGNPSGLRQWIEAHNGLGYLNPVMSRLINNSWQDNGGFVTTKPIFYFRDDLAATAGLFKLGATEITNESMRNSLGMPINLYSLFERMMDMPFGNISLCGNSRVFIAGTNEKAKSFSYYNHISQGRDIFYSVGNKNYHIVNFGLARRSYGDKLGIYYTDEFECDSHGQNVNNNALMRVYHLFDNNGSHVLVRMNGIRRLPRTDNDVLNTQLNMAFFKAQAEQLEELGKNYNIYGNEPLYHTINSLFELHKAFGGVYCKELDNNTGNLIYSEANNDIVTNFTIYVTDSKGNQILKDKMIGMFAMKSACKRGAGNINPADVLTTRKALRSMDISTENYLLVLDADKSVEDSEITELSLMVNGIGAVIGMHDEASDVYNALENIMKIATREDREAFEKWMDKDSSNKSPFYDKLIRYLITNYRGMAGGGMGMALIKETRNHINTNENHKNDKFFAPCSDPSIYPLLFKIFASALTSKALKRQFPGLGSVAVASHGMFGLYELRGEPYVYEDILRMALLSGAMANMKGTTDATIQNNAIVDQYLRNELVLAFNTPYNNVERFVLQDNVFYLLPGETPASIRNMSAEELDRHVVKLYNIHEYLTFKSNPIRYIAENKYGIRQVGKNKFQRVREDMTDLEYQRGLDAIQRMLYGMRYLIATVKPRDLRPKITSWEYRTSDGVWHYMNAFDDYRTAENSTYSEKDRLKLYDDLAAGRYSPDGGKTVYTTKSLNGEEPTLRNIRLSLIEMVMPYPYANKFGVTGMTLAQIRSNPNIFNRYDTLTSFGDSALALLKVNGQHQYISFNDVAADELVLPKGQTRNIDVNDPNKIIINRVYATNNRGDRLYEIARDKRVDGIRYINNLFVDLDGTVIRDAENYIHIGGGNVALRILFVRTSNFGENKKLSTRYHISYKDLNDVLIGEETASSVVAEIISDIYSTDMFFGIRPNIRLSEMACTLLYNAIPDIAKRMLHDPVLSNYLRILVYNLLKRATAEQSRLRTNAAIQNKSLDLNDVYMLIDSAKEQKAWREYCKIISDQVRASFGISTELAESRIPGQGPLSALGGKIVAFTNYALNQVYISLYNTWLQESDFDADKCWFMGYAFDGAGRFIGWSSLFDMSSELNLRASLYLPMPLGKKYTESSNTPTDVSGKITEYVDRIYKARISNKKDTPASIRAFAELITYLNRNNITEFYVPKNTAMTKSFRDVLRRVNAHEATKTPLSLREDAEKNYVAANMQRLTDGLRNTLNAYTPTHMDNIKRLGDAVLSRGDIMDPSFKLYILWLNLLAKDSIAIAANGQMTAFFMQWFLNSLLRDPKAFLDRGLSPFKTTRVKGRAKGKPEEAIINILPEVGVGIEGAEWLNDLINNGELHKLNPIIRALATLSELISASADNAKNPILAKINAIGEMMNMYITLITTGHELDDSVAFMTSPVARFISYLSLSNIFTGLDLNVYEAIRIASGDYEPLFYLFGRDLGMTVNDREKLEKGITTDLEGCTDAIGSAGWNAWNNIVDLIKMLNIKRGYKLSDPGVEEDRKDFENIYEAASELSALGNLLLAKRRVPTEPYELHKKFASYEKSYSSRIKGYNSKHTNDQILESTMDFARFLNDEEYRQHIIGLYNKAKKIVNIFDVFNTVPMTHGVLPLLEMASAVNALFTLRAVIFQKLYNELSQNIDITSESEELLLHAVDKAIILAYINAASNSSDITQKLIFPFRKSSKLINYLWLLLNADSDNVFEINSPTSVATFKRIFEQEVLPLLREGKYYDYENGKLVLHNEPSLKSNPFVNSVETFTDYQVLKLRTDVNTYLMDKSVSNESSADILKLGLVELNKYTICNHTLAEWFSIYNLLVNANRSGHDMMTPFFDILMRNGRFPYNYYSWLGSKDYNVDASRGIPYNETDTIINSAPHVADPLEIISRLLHAGLVLTERGLLLYRRTSKKIVKKIDNVILLPSVPNETLIDFSDRYNNFLQFGSVGGSIAEIVYGTKEALTFSDAYNEEITNPITEAMLKLRFVYAANNAFMGGFIDLLRTPYPTGKENRGKYTHLLKLTIANDGSTNWTHTFNIISNGERSQFEDFADAMFALLKRDAKQKKHVAIDLVDKIVKTMETTVGVRNAIISKMEGNESQYAWNYTKEQLLLLWPTLRIPQTKNPIYFRIVHQINDVSLKGLPHRRVLNATGQRTYVARNNLHDLINLMKLISVEEYIANGNKTSIFTKDSEQYALMAEIYHELHPDVSVKDVTSDHMKNMILHFIENGDLYYDVIVGPRNNRRSAHSIMSHIIEYLGDNIGDVYYDDPFVDDINSKLMFLRLDNGYYIASVGYKVFYRSLANFHLLELIERFGIENVLDFINILQSTSEKGEELKQFINSCLLVEPDFKWVVSGVGKLYKLIILKSLPRSLGELKFSLPEIKAMTLVGEHRGYRIYQKLDGHGNIYTYVAREYLGLGSVPRKLKLENIDGDVNDATLYIDKIIESLAISRNANGDLKMRIAAQKGWKGERMHFFSLLNYAEKSIIPSLDIELNPDTEFPILSERQYITGNGTLSGFHLTVNTWDITKDTKNTIHLYIDTPEKAYAFLYKVNEELGINRTNDDVIVSIANEINNVANDPTKMNYYYILQRIVHRRGEDKWNENKLPFEYYVIRTNPLAVELIYDKPHLPITTHLNAIEDAFNARLPKGAKKLLVELITSEMMKENFENVRHDAKAFVHNGKIYVNVSVALPTDLLHEYVHIILGIMKLNPDTLKNYEALMNVIMNSDRGKYVMERIHLSRQDLSTIDLAEEAFAELFSAYVMHSSILRTNSDGQSYILIFDAIEKNMPTLTIFNKDKTGDIRSIFKLSLEAGFSVFNKEVRNMLSKRKTLDYDTNVRNPLQVLNWISKLITETKKIIENCK